jgi:hypothetical protein
LWSDTTLEIILWPAAGPALRASVSYLARRQPDGRRPQNGRVMIVTHPPYGTDGTDGAKGMGDADWP